MPTSIHRFNNVEQFEAHADEWIRFCDSIQPLPPFCRPQTWIPGLQTLLEQGEADEIVIFEARENEDLRALFALYRTRNLLKSLSENHLDYQEIAASDPVSAAKALERAVRFSREENLIFILGNVSEQSMLSQALGRASFNHLARTFRRYFGLCIVSDFEMIEAGGEALVSSFSKRQRKNFNYASNRIKAQLPEMELQFLEGSEISSHCFEQISTLHQTNQQHRTGQSPFANPIYLEFLNQQAKHQPNLLLSRILADGELVAFCLGYFEEGVYYYYITDYDRRFASVSPGLWLMNKTCIHVADQSPTSRFRIDFLLGSESYKTQWETGRYYVDRVIIIPKTIKRLPWSLSYLSSYSAKHFKNRLLGIGSRAE